MNQPIFYKALYTINRYLLINQVLFTFKHWFVHHNIHVNNYLKNFYVHFMFILRKMWLILVKNEFPLFVSMINSLKKCPFAYFADDGSSSVRFLLYEYCALTKGLSVILLIRFVGENIWLGTNWTKIDNVKSRIIKTVASLINILLYTVGNNQLYKFDKPYLRRSF